MRRRFDRRLRVLAAVAGLLMGMAAALAPGAMAAAAGAAAGSVDATIEPSQIALGESAQLTILMSGNGALSVSLPVVPGLEFRVVAQARQIQIINGSAISSTSTIIRVTPEESGVFTIPGPTPKSPSLVLRVTQDRSAAPVGPPNNSKLPGLNSFLRGGSEANGIRMTPDGSAFVRLEVPKHELYVGESIPAEIQVGLRNGFAASNSLPKLNSGDFTLNNLSFQPERSEKVIDGKPFTLFTWHSLLAPIKPGTYTLIFTIPATVRVRTQPRGDSMIDDLLGDPFMQNFFGASVTKNISVSSPEVAFTVLPLPTEGRPADFGGAVGHFKISTDVSSATTTAGDPLTLRLHVNGAGTFDRVDSTMLPADAHWKTYQPKSSFHQADAAGYRGEKVFEQPLIASQPGLNPVPPLSFSFFDPGTRRFETVHSAQLTVAVAPSAADTTGAPPPPPPLAGAEGANGEVSHGLRPDHAETGARVATLMPPYFQPRYFAIPSVLAFLFGGGWVALRRRERRGKDIERASERVRAQMIHAALGQMAAASADDDAASFVNAARSALRQTMGARWQMDPGQIGWPEVQARIGGSDRKEVLQIFALADEANYSGGGLHTADFDRWTQLVRRQIAETGS